MRTLTSAALVALALGGCTAEDAFTGSPHGYSGHIDTFWADVTATPTILQPGEAPLHSFYSAEGSSDMPSTFSVDVAGNLTATGYAAYWMSLARLCTVAPNAAVCGGPGAPR